MKKFSQQRFLLRFARIGGIVFILFLSMFAMDIFDMHLGFRGTLLGLFMHLIPTRILIIALAFAWRKYPLVGTIVFWIFGMRYVGIIIQKFFTITPAPYYMLLWPVIIAIPPILIGLAFLLHWLDFRKSRRK